MKSLLGKRGKTRGVVAGLVPAISIRMLQCSIIGMAGTSPAMTCGKGHEFCPCYAVSYQVFDFAGAPYGTRTRVSAVKGRRPGPLDEGRSWSGATYRSVWRDGQAIDRVKSGDRLSECRRRRKCG